MQVVIPFVFILSANEEIVKVKRATEGEMVVLQAALRKAEMQAQSLEQTVEQKVCFSQESHSSVVVVVEAYLVRFTESYF